MSNIKTWPERIWLHNNYDHDDLSNFDDIFDDLSWCNESMGEHDIEYVRKDIVEELQLVSDGHFKQAMSNGATANYYRGLIRFAIPYIEDHVKVWGGTRPDDLLKEMKEALK